MNTMSKLPTTAELLAECRDMMRSVSFRLMGIKGGFIRVGRFEELCLYETLRDLADSYRSMVAESK